MANLAIMNWNIEKLSWDKIRINGMADAIARTVATQNIDLLIILEIMLTDAAKVIASLTTAFTNIPGQPTNKWVGFLSAPTGAEHYAFFIRDLNAIRPIMIIQPSPLPQKGAQGLSTNP